MKICFHILGIGSLKITVAFNTKPIQFFDENSNRLVNTTVGIHNQFQFVANTNATQFYLIHKLHICMYPENLLLRGCEFYLSMQIFSKYFYSTIMLLILNYSHTMHSIFLGFKMKPAELIKGIFQIFLLTKFHFSHSFL